MTAKRHSRRLPLFIVGIVVLCLILTVVALFGAALLLRDYEYSQHPYVQPVGKLVLGSEPERKAAITAYATAQEIASNKQQFATQGTTIGKTTCTATMYGYDQKYVFANMECTTPINDPGAIPNSNYTTAFSIPTRYTYDASTHKVTASVEEGDDDSNPAIWQMYPVAIAKRANTF